MSIISNPDENRPILLPLVCVEKEFMNNTNIARQLATKQLKQGYTYEALAYVSKEMVPIYTKFTLTHDPLNDQQIHLFYDITPYDMAVMDAVYTLAKNGVMEFSADSIARVMSANPDQKVTDYKRNAIAECMKRLSYISLEINYTREYNDKATKKLRNVSLESYLMPVSKIEAVSSNGRQVMHAYRLLEIPALYRYAEQRGHIMAVPANVFTSMSEIKDTEESIVLKRYLVQRIEQMKNKRNNISSYKISYQWKEHKADHSEMKGLYTALGYHRDDYTERSWEKKKMKLNKTMRVLLSCLKQCGYITDFQEYRISKSGQEYSVDSSTANIHTGALCLGGFYISP